MLGNLSCADFSTLYLFVGNFLFQPFWTAWFWSPLCNCSWAEWCPGLRKPPLLEPQRCPRLVQHVMSQSCCPQLAPKDWEVDALFSEVMREPPKLDTTTMLVWICERCNAKNTCAPQINLFLKTNSMSFVYHQRHLNFKMQLLWKMTEDGEMCLACNTVQMY